MAIVIQEELGLPALAFVRAVCEVLGLDDSIADETAVLRRNLLRLTQVREFADEAAFKVPARTITPDLLFDPLSHQIQCLRMS